MPDHKAIKPTARATARLEELRILRKSKELHPKWYQATYPDVAALKMEPARHYLTFGALLGRNPGKTFDTAAYLGQNPAVMAAELNPLVHYERHGLAGTAPAQAAKTPAQAAKDAVALIRTKLLSQGFTEAPLAELEALAAESPHRDVRALAARDLALWSMRRKCGDGYRDALAQVARARRAEPDPGFRGKLAVIEIIARYLLGEIAEGEAAYNRAALAGEATLDVMLAGANLQATPEGRCLWINQAFRRCGVAEVALSPDRDLPAYDRLCAGTPLAPVPDGRLVTVLVAAYNAAETIGTALRSLRDQTWRNLEILVLDDASSDTTAAVVEAHCALDPRVRLLRMERNGGAYVARNRGLAEARGAFVTLQDADDWSHPSRIETQAVFLGANPRCDACTVEQARATADLEFTRWTGAAGEIRIVKENVSSLLFRREPVMAAVGGWDPVRFGADTEFRNRLRAAKGAGAIASIPNALLSLQRATPGSSIAHGFFGYDGFFFGARLDYHEGQMHFRRSAGRHRFSPDRLTPAFPVPVVMRPDRQAHSAHFDVIIGSEFRMHGGSTRSNIEEMLAQKEAGLRTGVFQMYRYDYDSKIRRHMLAEARDALDPELCCPLVYGEEATCDLLLLRYPPILQHPQRYLPRIRAKAIKVIVNQTPMSDYSARGVVRFDLDRCAANLRAAFGGDAVWHPIGPLVREALLSKHADQIGHIELSDADWHNIIDLRAWSRGARRRGPADRLRIGRHSRDHFTKWPATRADLLAAYPAREDIEVHVLGGAAVPAAILGEAPPNWTVQAFGAVHPRDFLATIDVFVYFAHPEWVESFGRTIIEAMAVGVPVILPAVYRPLFGDAALYATPQTAISLARDLHADPDAYGAQAEKAKAHVTRTFSYEMHLNRLKTAGVRRNAP